MARLFEEVLGRGPVGATDSFFDLGGHSLTAVVLIGKLKRQLGLALPPAALLTGGTVEQLARLARQQGGGTPSPLVPLALPGKGPAAKGRPLFLVHPIGGSVFCYAELARRLGEARPVYGFEAQPVNGTRPSIPAMAAPSVPTMAASYVEALKGVQPQGPYLLGGWSMGGVIAHEMARQLTAAGESVQVLALLDAHPPAALRLPEAADERQLLAWFRQDLARQLGREAIAAEAAEESFAGSYHWALEAGLLPAGLGLDEARARFDLFRANVAALAAHTPGTVAGKVALFAAGTGERAPDWSAHAPEGVDLVSFETDHYRLLAVPTVEAVAAELSRRLAEAA